MGALTVGDIGTRVMRQFGDEAGAQITDADIIRWVNDAVREVVQQNDLLQKRGTANTVANQKDYALPNDILRMRRVAYNGIVLRPITIQEADELVPSHDQSTTAGYPVGTPSHYWVWAGNITLYPAPDQSITNGLSLYYTRQPIAVALDADVPETPSEYDNRIIEFCLGQAFELDMNTTMMQIKKNEFAQGVQMLKGQADWENQEFYPNVSMISEYPDDIVGSAY